MEGHSSSPSLSHPADEDCPLKEAASRKIPRLTVKVRKGCGSPGSPLPPQLGNPLS